MYYRYERERMKAIWSEDNGFDLWLRVEVAACVAWAELGVVPQEDAEKIRGARFDRELYDRWFEQTKHDLVSFTRSVTPSLGPEGRWIHHGLTSNDVKDTALSLQLVQVGRRDRRGHRALHGGSARAGGGVLRHAVHGPLPRGARGADELRPQARALVGRDAAPPRAPCAGARDGPR